LQRQYEFPSDIIIGATHAFNRKKPLIFSDVNEVETSSELKDSLKKKYIHYLLTFWLVRLEAAALVYLVYKIGTE